MKFSILKQLMSSEHFQRAHWLLYKDDLQMDLVLQKYRSKKSYATQELKILIKAISLVGRSKRSKISNDFSLIHSDNQYNSLFGIHNEYSMSLLTFEYDHPQITRLRLKATSLFVLFLFILFNCRQLRRRTIKQYHFHQLKALIYTLILIDNISFTKTRFCFVSNDHRPETRVILFLKTIYPIQTVYKQHAQISLQFPPLEWDHAILDGNAAKSYYEQIGPIKSTIWIAGNDKTAILTQSRTTFSAQKIGIALNSLDNLSLLTDYLRLIQEIQPNTCFSLRLHPAMQLANQPNIQKLLDDKKIVISVHQGTLQEYLSEISVCIAGVSSILLEAAIANKLCVQHNFVPNNLVDYYQFNKEGLSISTDDFAILLRQDTNWLEKIDKQSLNARFFSQSLGTVNEGKELNAFMSFIRNK